MTESVCPFLPSMSADLCSSDQPRTSAVIKSQSDSPSPTTDELLSMLTPSMRPAATTYHEIPSPLHSPSTLSAEQHFFLSCASSPSFTTRTGSPFFTTTTKAPVPTIAPTPITVTAMPSSSSQPLRNEVRPMGPSEAICRSEGPATAEGLEGGTASPKFLRPVHLAIERCESSLSMDDGSSTTSGEQGSLLTITPSRPTSGQSWRQLEPESQEESQIKAACGHAPVAVKERQISLTSVAASSHSTSNDTTSRSGVDMPLSSHLHAKLVSERLTKAPASVQRELGSLESTLKQPGEQLIVVQSQPAQSIASVSMSERQGSASSEISRTPSTSTSGSLTAHSSVSAETTPSSVLSEGGVTLDTAEGKTSSEDSEVSTPLQSTFAMDTFQTRLKRYLALLELYETEQSYARDLSLLLDVYMDLLPLQQYFEDHPARVEVVVRNTPELVKLHSVVTADLGHILQNNYVATDDVGTVEEKAMSEGLDSAIVQIGQYFQAIEHHLLIYTDFCARHSEALAIVRGAAKRHNGDDFGAYERLCWNVMQSRALLSRRSSFVDLTQRSSRSGSSTPSVTVSPSSPSCGSTSASPRWAVATPSLAPSTPLNPDILTLEPSVSSASVNKPGGRLTFADLLIKPIQRLCLYPLILQTVLKHTSPQDAGFRELEAAIASVERAAREVNRVGKEREQFLLAELVASRMEPHGTLTHSLLSSLGNVKLSGTLDVLYHHSYYSPLTAPLRFRYLGLFLYQHQLVIVKVRKSRTYGPNFWFPLVSAKLSSIEEDEGVLPHAFRLSIDDHHFELAASSSRERALWASQLSSAIEAAASAAERLAGSDTKESSPDPADTKRYPSCLPASRRPARVHTNLVAAAAERDPLNVFLAYQSANANSSEVLVRYASISQRAAIDRGMIFSEAILSARSISQRDGTFTPGGSITKSSSTTSGSTTPTAMTVAGLTAWPPSSNTSTSSLGAAVGAAMGLAIAARRSGRQSVSSNISELAAQQYLAAEEQRWNEGTKHEYFSGLTTGNDASLSRTQPDSSSQRHLTTSPRSASSYFQQQHRKRPSLVARGDLRPLFTNLSLSKYAPSAEDVDDMDSLRSRHLPGSEEPVVASESRPSPGGPISAFPTSLSLDTQVIRRRRSFLGASGSVLRDAFPVTWSRRGRSQSTNLDIEDTLATPAASQPSSPMPKASYLPVSHELPTSSPYDESTLRRSTLRHALTGLSERRERAQSAFEPRVLENSPDNDVSQPAFETPDRQLVVSTRSSPSFGRPQGERRRTSSSFGNSFSLVGPPMESLRRFMSLSRWSTTGRIKSSSRSSDASTIGGNSALQKGNSLSLGEGSASQSLLPLDFDSSSSPVAGSTEKAAGVQNFGKSSRDTELVVGETLASNEQRPASSQSSTSPMMRLGQLHADLLNKARAPSKARAPFSLPASRLQSRRGSVCSNPETNTTDLSDNAAPHSGKSIAGRDCLTASTSSVRSGSQRKTGRLSALFAANNSGQLNFGRGSTGSVTHSRSNSSEAGDVTVSRPFPLAVSAHAHCLSFGSVGILTAPQSGTSAATVYAMPSPLTEENENTASLNA